MKITPNQQRLKVKEIICEKPANIITNIKLYDKNTGEAIMSCSEGAFCFGRNNETISLTFPEGNLYIEKQGENYFLINEE
jgi:hypothetical protein